MRRGRRSPTLRHITNGPCLGPRGRPTKRQWRYAGNIRHNAAIRSGLWTMTHPRSMLRRRAR